MSLSNFLVGLLFLCILFISAQSQNNATLLYELNSVDYVWQNETQKDYYIQNGLYIVENNAITGIKAWKGTLFVTVPRWRTGVPSTLNKIVTVNNKTLLEPYPSWDYQEIGNPSALQYVQSMEIDSRGWMWILDVGRRNFLGDPSTVVSFAPKLVIWDISNGCVIRTFVFPDNVLAWNNSFANDIVIDETNGFAYISDTAGDGGIVVYDFNHNLARLFTDPTLQGNASNEITINNITYNVGNPSDGIALSHDASVLFYCDLSRTHLWSIATKILSDFTLSSAEISQHIVDLGAKGYSDGMAFASSGWLYYGNVENNGVDGWNYNSGLPLNTAIHVVANDTTMQWIDTFAFDGQGNLLFTSNRLQLYIFGGMDFTGADGPNFRIWSVPVNANSYLSGNPVPPSLPCQVQ